MQYLVGSKVVVGFGVVVVVVVVVVVLVVVVVVVVGSVVVSTTGSDICATSFGPTVCSDIVVIGLGTSWDSWKLLISIVSTIIMDLTNLDLSDNG